MVRQQGVTVFLTTHNLVEADKVCDRVAVIRMGKLLTAVPRRVAMQKAQDTSRSSVRGFRNVWSRSCASARGQLGCARKPPA